MLVLAKWAMAQDGFIVPVDSIKKKTAVSRSWILLDSSGEGTILDLDRQAIMRGFPINARDLRILDPMLSYPSTILGREKAIVLNLEHIKAIITTEEVLLRDPLDDNVVPIVEELQRRLPMALGQGEGEDDDRPEMRNEVETDAQTEFPFEFRALEVALEGICSFLDARTRELETAAYPALDELTSKISSRNLDRVRKLKSAMTRLTSRVQKVRDELEQLLDDDDDMADLYLSRKLAGVSSPVSGQGIPNWFPASPTLCSKISKASRTSGLTAQSTENDVEELEMLLEAYFMQIESTMNKLTTLREYIDDTEDYINIQLDNHRNQLIQCQISTVSRALQFVVSTLIALFCHLLLSLLVTAAGVIPKFWYCLFINVLFGGCNIWDEYPLYMERTSRLYIQMGGYPHRTCLCFSFPVNNFLCQAQGSCRVMIKII